MNTPYSMTPMASRTRPPVAIFGIARTACTVLAPPRAVTASYRVGGDLFPQLPVLLLVRGPDLLLRQFLERRVVRHVHCHAEGLQLFLGLGQRIDRLGV